MTGAASFLIGLLPVVLFLAGLRFMDSFKLVSRAATLRSIAAGCAAALLALVVNRVALDALHLDPRLLTRYVAPLVEESLKAAYVIYLIRASRVGFMVDAGIHGFAVGAGFAVVENIYYALALGDAQLILWIVRGLGTAMMHGTATAIVAIRSKDLADRHGTGGIRWFLPGLAIAVLVHSFFNHLVLHPLVSTAILLLAMPLLLFVVFERSEKGTRDWLGTGMDNDVELLELIASGEIGESRVGRYLESLKSRFPGHVMGDMLCLLRIYLELSMRAKGMLIARAAGVTLPPDEGVRENFEEMKFLERSIGKTGRIALLPILPLSGRDLWQLHMLGR